MRALRRKWRSGSRNEHWRGVTRFSGRLVLPVFRDKTQPEMFDRANDFVVDHLQGEAGNAYSEISFH